MKPIFNRLSLLVLTTGALLVLAPVWAGAAEDPALPKELKKGQYNSLQYTTTAGDLMYYYLYLPTSYTPTRKLPILAEVHGAGPQQAKPGHTRMI
jgi:dipeptidyl aminopeptidase/acylaminoacyl peptidase